MLMVNKDEYNVGSHSFWLPTLSADDDRPRGAALSIGSCFPSALLRQNNSNNNICREPSHRPTWKLHRRWRRRHAGGM